MQKEKLGVEVVSAVYDSARYSNGWGPGVRDVYILHYVKKGKGVFIQDGKRHRICAGQIFVIYPGEMVFYYPDEEDPWEYTWVEAVGLEVKHLLEQCSLTVRNPVVQMEEKYTEELFRQTAKSMSSYSAAERCRRNGYMHLILAELMTQAPLEKVPAMEDDPVVRAVALIENNYRKQSLNLEFICNELNLNRVSLYRHFMRDMGISPKQYINDLRIEKASALLSDSRYPIKSIAYSTGFSDPLYFSKAFRKNTGMTPKEYRENQVKMREQNKNEPCNSDGIVL